MRIRLIIALLLMQLIPGAMSAQQDSFICITIQAGPANSMNAVISSVTPDKTIRSAPSFKCSMDSSGKVETRSLLKFDLSCIPSRAFIQSAMLHLNHDAKDIYDSLAPIENTCALHKITSPWSDSTVTWRKQPTTDSFNIHVLYPDLTDSIDITDFVANTDENRQDILLGQVVKNFGIMIESESAMSMSFGSGYHTNPKLRPTLEICYMLPVQSNRPHIRNDKK